MGEKYETWPGSGSWIPIGVSFNLAHDFGLERMRVTASSISSGSLEHPFTVSTLSTMTIDFEINVEPAYDNIEIRITDGGSTIHNVVVNAGTGPYHFNYSFLPSNTNVKLELHTIVITNQVDYTLDNIRVTQDNTGTTSSCIDIAANPSALEGLFLALYNCNPEKLLAAFLSQPGFNQDLLLDLESYFASNFSYYNLLDQMKDHFSEKYLGQASAAVFLAQTVNKADILHYLNTYHSGYGVSALALVTQNDYLQYLYQVVQSSYESCEFYHCVGSCASSDDWTTPTLALGSCANTLTYPLTSIPQNDELINANLYYCYSADFEGKIHPNLLTSFTNSHIVAANSNAFEEAVAAFPYRNLVLMMHGPGGNTSLFSFQMHCNKEKLAETIYRLYPHEFLDIVKNYVSLNTILGSFSIFVNYDEPSTIIQLISPGILAPYLESNYSGNLTSILNDFSSTYGSLLGRISYQAFEECEFKDCVLEHWPGIGVDSSLIYDFIREHHWVNALKNILLNQEDDFNKQFSYLYPVMLAEVLETYTPEARYSMSTFLDGVESYFGYETRRAISTDSTQHYGLLVLNELHLYGSARLGMIQTNDTLFEFDLRSYYDLGNTQTPEGYNLDISQPHVWDSLYTHQRGSKVYEGTNHLGNLLVTYSDKRLSECFEDTLYRYVADVKSQTDYSAFGVLLEERQWYANQDSGAYRFGFNNQEQDDDISGYGNSVSFRFRVHDTRLGRFLSVDPLEKEYPWNSTYAFAENDVIRSIDLEGRERLIVIYDFSSEKITKTKIDLPKEGSLGNGILIQSNHGGKIAYYYGNDISDPVITSFKKAYEGVVTDENGNHVGYKDHLGNPTIGYGHLIKKGEPYKVGSTITESEAQTLFNNDSKSIFSIADKYLDEFSLNENQKNALYDASFNMGPGKLSQYNEDGEKFSGENFFLQFMGGGEGLKKRRYAENLLYSEGLYLHLDVITNSKTQSTAEKIVNDATAPPPSTDDE